MKKKETIKRRGIEAYNRELALSTIWWEEHPKRRDVYARERNRPGGKYYKEVLRKNGVGLRKKRANRRCRDGGKYRPFKNRIDPLGASQLHHCWLRNSAECRGVALVEKNQHMHGFINVIEIFEGKIMLFTEEEIRNQVE